MASGETPTLLVEASDGSSRWRYRRYEFTVMKDGLWWSPPDGILIPLDVSYPGPIKGDQLALMGQVGFASLTRRRLIRRCCRTVDRHLAEHVRDGVLRGRQPDARQVQA